MSFDSPDQLTDNANATRFVERHYNELRYVPAWKSWIVWTGQRWKRDTGGIVTAGLMRDHMKRLWSQIDDKQAAQVKFATDSNSASKIRNALELAKSDRKIILKNDKLDTHPYLLNCENGTLDLQTMKFRDHKLTDYLTQIAGVAYDPEARCPLWQETITLIFGGDEDLSRYVQALIGYCLSGDTDEHIMPICYGSGANGKSTLWETFRTLMGDYFELCSTDLLMPQGNRTPYEIADLFGKRFVAISEPDKGRRLSESRIKDMTGDKILKCRRLYQDFWTFRPTHKFWMSTNHKPQVKGDDDGIWRRLKLIPFNVDLRTVTTPDPKHVDRLVEELPGILNWCLIGWEMYQGHGLKAMEPKAVSDATQAYRHEEDVIGLFVSECYETKSGLEIGCLEAYEDFQRWGGKWSQTTFGREMSRRFDKVRRHQNGKKPTFYSGIGRNSGDTVGHSCGHGQYSVFPR